jgi:hypothetical protein
MEITYMMVGADGQQYGPVTQQQLMGWIREGRVTAATLILRSDVNSWLPAAQYTELGLSQPMPMSSGAPPAISAAAPLNNVATANLVRRAKSGAGWFYFIGVFSAINSIVLLMGHPVRFVVGLGITDEIMAFGSGFGSGGLAVCLALDALVLAIFVTFGFFAKKGHSWSFIVGMVCYFLDAGLRLLEQDVIGVLFHGLGLVFMFLGLMANTKLKAMQRGAAAGAAGRA